MSFSCVDFQTPDRPALLFQRLGQHRGQSGGIRREFHERDLAGIPGMASQEQLDLVANLDRALPRGQVLNQGVALPPRRHDDRHVEIHVVDFPPKLCGTT